MVKFPETHKIIRVKKDTWTIWFRWFAKSEKTVLVPVVCENICDYCKSTLGRCMSENTQVDYDIYVKNFVDDANHDGAPKFYYASEQLDKALSRRRRAIKLKCLS